MIGLRTLKMVVGALLAVLIANLFSLSFALSAGIITMLSILDTKRQSVATALSRILATIFGLTLAGIVFYSFGVSLYTYGVVLLIFIPIATKFELTSAIIINAVLISHLLSFDTVKLAYLLNEFYLLIIGISMGLLLNTYVPSKEDEIKYQQIHIEELMKKVLHNFSLNLTNQCGIDEINLIDELEKQVQLGKKLAYTYLNNHFFIDHTYYVEYMEMREKQLFVLKSMNKQLNQVFHVEAIPVILSMVTEEIKEELSESNDVYLMLEGLSNIRLKYKNRALPKTRVEFEERARLYAYFNDLEEFLHIKGDFLKHYKELKYCKI